MNKFIRHALTGILWLTLLTNAAIAQINRPNFPLQKIKNEVETGININHTITRRSLVSRTGRLSFNLGAAFIRAAYYASVSDQDAESAERAMVELAKLSARFDAQPTVQNALDKALKMVTHGQGTAHERWQIVALAGDLQSRELGAESLWFYQTGAAVTRLRVENVARNENSVRAELQNLENLFKVASDFVPIGVLQLMNSIVDLAETKAFTNSQYLVIDQRLGELSEAVNG